MRSFALLIAAVLVLATPMWARVPGNPDSAASVSPTSPRTVLWRFRNQTKADLEIRVRLLDVPWCRAATLSDDGRMTVASGELGSLRARFVPLPPAPTGAAPERTVGKALVLLLPGGKEAGSQWLVHEFAVDDRATIEPLVIDEQMLSRRRDVLFIRNDSSHSIHLSMPTLQVPSETAAEGKDYLLRTTGDLSSDSLVLRPGASAPWLILTQLGSVGAGSRLVDCSLRTEGFNGRCGLDWKSYVTGVIRFDDQAIAKLDTDAKALAAESARRELEAVAARQAAAERAAEAAESRRVAFEQRRQQQMRAQQQQGNLLAAGALILGLLLVGDMMSDDGWGWGGGGGDESCPACCGGGYHNVGTGGVVDGQYVQYDVRQPCSACGGSGRR